MNDERYFATPFSLAGSVSDAADFVARKRVDDCASASMRSGYPVQSATREAGAMPALPSLPEDLELCK